jgi:Tol biopolymer transport system component/DNA-binding winged helix-turn-helix (wHTH) protein
LKVHKLELEIDWSVKLGFWRGRMLDFIAQSSQGALTMERAARSRQVVRFGVFELDLRTRELRKQGVRIKLQGQPFQILEMLLEQPGELVTREELQQRLWADGSFVDYEQGLNIAIKKLRLALGDSADSPRFVETLARRGYRFIAPVEGAVDGSDVCTERNVSAAPAHPENKPLRKTRWTVSRLVWSGVLLALMTALTVWFHVAHSGSKSSISPPRIIPLTSYPGEEIYPALSPDGNMLAFSWNGEKEDNFDIYVKLLDSGAPMRLTTNPADDFSPVWSPDGRNLAFLRSNGQYFDIILIPALGGVERKLWQSEVKSAWELVGLSWSPDGKFLAFADKSSESHQSIFLLSIETGERRRLTYPPECLDDLIPAFSPDGQSLAFVRSPEGIYLVSLLEGTSRNQPRRLALDGKTIGGLTFSSDGRSVVFSSYRNGNNLSLWRISTHGGEPQRLSVGEQNVLSPSVARHGDRLVYRQDASDMNIWRIEALHPGPHPFTTTRHPPTRLIASTTDDMDPRFSPDGKKIAFSSGRSGWFEIWVCDSDGRNPIQVTDLGGQESGSPRWSPDGRFIAFDSAKEGSTDIYVTRAEGGTPRRLTTEDSHDARPSWSKDGRWIYFGSNRSGDFQIWKLPSQGGTAVQVTRQGGYEALESPDGKWLYYAKQDNVKGIWRVPVEGGEESQVIADGQVGLWGVATPGIFLLGVHLAPPCVKLFSFATHRLTEITTLKDSRVIAEGSTTAVSPDGPLDLIRPIWPAW